MSTQPTQSNWVELDSHDDSEFRTPSSSDSQNFNYARSNIASESQSSKRWPRPNNTRSFTTKNNPRNNAPNRAHHNAKPYARHARPYNTWRNHNHHANVDTTHASTTSAQPRRSAKDLDIATDCCYATMVINNSEYLAGAMTLAYSLQLSGSQAQRAIIIDQDISTQYGDLIRMTSLFHTIFVIPRKLQFRAVQKQWKKYAESGIYDWIDTAFNKYYCFQLTQYARVVMLDADQLCLQNPDALFRLPSCPAGICSLYSELNNALQSRTHGRLVPNADVRRAMERQWGIRGCLFMIEPSMSVFNDMLSRLEHAQRNHGGVGNTRCFLGADEKFLTQYFMTDDGDSQPSRWTHIHAKFSRLSYIDKTQLDEDPFFLHFCTFKPWKRPPTAKWEEEMWEDLAIWVFAATATQLHVNQRCLRDDDGDDYKSRVARLASVMTPDLQFFKDVLSKEWSQKYLQMSQHYTGAENKLLLALYHEMKASYTAMQADKQQQTKQLRSKMRQLQSQSQSSHNVAIDTFDSGDVRTHHQHGPQPPSSSFATAWSFDYGQTSLLSALLAESAEKVPDKVIWQFWHEPYDAMPPHIKLCVDSVRRNNPDFAHVLVTPQNIWRYLDEHQLPRNLLQFEKACHVSDVVRVALLAKYGGIYCDASVICFRQGRNMCFDFFWDQLLMQQGVDFVGFRYDTQKTKWKNDEQFCCWVMAAKKDCGLFHAWLGKINALMKDKTSNSQLKLFDLLYSGDAVAFKKYVALGPGILDELFLEYCHYHPNFKYQLYDPRDFALLDQFFNYQQLWYLHSNDAYNFKDWFRTKSPHLLKLFCAQRGAIQLSHQLRQKFALQNDQQITQEHIMKAGLIVSDIFQCV